jgi:hypothetical protein
MKLEFPREILEKSSSMKFYENPSIGSPVVPCGRTHRQTDRHDEANTLVAILRRRLKNVGLASNGPTFIPSFGKIEKLVQKLKGENHTQHKITHNTKRRDTECPSVGKKTDSIVCAP